jgi:lipopolysaccharide export system permease protein
MALMALRIFERYLMGSLLSAMAYVFVALFALFSFFEFLGQIADVGGDGAYTIQQALLVSFFRVPVLAYQAVPIAVLIGALISLSQFAKNSELNVLRVSGVSTPGLLWLLFKVAAIVALLTFFWGEAVSPYSDRFAQSIRPNQRQSSGLKLPSGYWVKDGSMFVNIREVTARAELKDIQLYEFDGEGRLAAVKTAEYGTFVQTNLWRLGEVKQTRYSIDGGAHITTASEELWESNLSPDVLAVLNVVPERMSAVTLINYIGHLSSNRQSSDRYQVALWKRLVYPMTCFVMVALALPFAYFQGRSSGAGLKLFAGVMLGISFYVLDGLSSSLGQINHWPPLFSALGPLVGFMLLAVAMIWWVDRR